MTLKNVIVAFLSSRGGLIVLSAVVAVVARILLWPFTTRDWVIAGLIVALWPTFEYIAHRWVFHEWTWTPFRKTHDRHHDEPTTETGLPDLWVIADYYLLSVAFVFATSGIYTAHATVLVMLSVYEFIHFSCHCNYTPKTWWGWSVRTNHLQHHKLQSADRYAMSFPIFRVTGKVKKGISE
jgi:uncharacterized membrane protein (GlpM family)